MADIYRMGFLGRIWDALLTTSEAAVAVHYHAPWRQAEPVPPPAGCRDAAPGLGGACPV